MTVKFFELYDLIDIQSTLKRLMESSDPARTICLLLSPEEHTLLVLEFFEGELNKFVEVMNVGQLTSLSKVFKSIQKIWKNNLDFSQKVSIGVALSIGPIAWSLREAKKIDPEGNPNFELSEIRADYYKRVASLVFEIPNCKAKEIIKTYLETKSTGEQP